MERRVNGHADGLAHESGIAVVGIGCRLPGRADSPAAFWQLLLDGRDAVRETPRQRWSAQAFHDKDSTRPGHMLTRMGGYLEDVAGFDASFFGISPREAVRMDPQQRLFLETTWEALQDAGILPEQLARTNTAVFVGSSGHDYGILQLNPQNRDLLGGHTMSGVTNCVIANRVSYLLDLKGPSMVVDTACSSSLVAVHLACRAIRAGESDIAIVGGVQTLLAPETTIAFSQGTFLSADGRCKSFDARANGYVRSEGSGTLILKPLQRAIKDGDSIYAVIRGTATNQDGRTNGMTVPSEDSQYATIIEACRDAGITPGEIQFVEAHGTGTPVGDPIEAKALGRALAVGRNGSGPCLVGAVKSNIGHLESAAGIAGLIKVCLVAKHGVIPRNLHLETPNPSIPFAELPLRLATKNEAWPEQGTRFAGVNSFGFGGSNAHVVVERPPAEVRKDRFLAQQGTLFALSAKTPEVLGRYARAYLDYLAAPETDAEWYDIAATQGLHRAHYEHRLAFSASSKEQARALLAAFVEGQAPKEIQTGARDQSLAAAPVVFVFSGQGPQWWAMGRELLVHNELFRRTVQRVHTELSKYADWSLFEELWRDEATSRIGETFVAQPAMFALQVGLAAVWESWGIKPAAVIGHSIGEVAAAYVSGCLSLEQAVRVIFQRSHAQQKASGLGKMLAVGLPLAAAREFESKYAGRISVAAVNGPESVALAGDPDALELIAAELDARGVFCRMLQVKVAFHSHHMDPLREELLSSLTGLQPGRARVPMYSTVTGSPVAAGELTAEYWWRNVREPVLFSPTIETLIEQGQRIFIELGPHPIHATAIGELLSRRKLKGLTLPSLIRKQPDTQTLMTTLGALYVHGREPSWSGVYPAAHERARLPLYPWSREPYWLEADSSAQTRFPSLTHPLLGERLEVSNEPDLYVWQLKLDPLKYPWLDDHRVQGPIVFPAAAHLDMMLGCFHSVFGEDKYSLENVEFRRALFVFDDRPPPLVQVVLTPERNFSIRSRQANEKEWSVHVVGNLGAKTPAPEICLTTLRSQCTRETDPELLHARLRKGGLALGTTFRALSRLVMTDNEALADIDTPDGVLEEGMRHHIHPGVLDSCITSNAVIMGLDPNSESKTLYLPVGVGRLSYYSKPGARIHCVNVARPSSDPHCVEGELMVFNEDGSPVLYMQGFKGKSITQTAAGESAAMQWLYDFQWAPAPLEDMTRHEAGFLPDGARLHAAAQPVVQELLAWDLNQKYHAQAEPGMNQLCLGYMVNALLRLGLRFEIGRRFTSEAVARELGVPAKLGKYLNRWLSLLAEHALLRQVDDGWEVLKVPAPLDTEQLLATLRAEHPEFMSEYAIMQRCGEAQARVLRDEVNPIEVIFPDHAFESMEELYGTSFSGSKYNRIAQAIMRACVRSLPAGRKLRVLEIGGGTAGVTSHLLGELPPEQTKYVFTDIAPVFLARARERFAQFEFVDYQTLDIEKDLEEQGFARHSFDIVIASNVLHATEALRATLENVKRLLTSRGQLIVIEATAQPHWVDLSFGMTDGWWKFCDYDLRPNYPLLSQAGWQSFLQSVGFDQVHGSIDTTSVAQSGNVVLVARGPELDLNPFQPRAPQGAWLVLDDERGLGERFVQQLGEAAAGSVFVKRGSALRKLGEGRFEVAPTDREQLRQLLAIVRASERGCAGVLHAWGLDYQASELSLETLQAAEREAAYSVVSVLQALDATDWPMAPAFWICTRGAQGVTAGEGPVSLPQVMSWGVLRVMLSERSSQKAKVLDLDPEDSLEACAEHLVAELLAQESAEEEILIRGGTRYVHRLRHQTPEAFKAQGQETVELSQHAVELVPPAEHQLHQLGYVNKPRAALGAHEVEVRVSAAGLNFRDVMLSLGLLAEGATFGGYYDDHIGVECAGTVARVGSAVTSLQVGAKVVAFARGCFGSFVVAPESCVLPSPRGLSDEQAAALPMAYLTAYYALVEVGGLRRGQSVLIHAATGGVGLAAVHIAKLLGATVYATAGRDAKREYLRQLGVADVFDSRSTAFAQEVRARVGERGLDVVLNSLSGEQMAVSVGLLGACGRFVEIGKKDIYENYKLGLRPFGNNLSYSAVDIDRLLRIAPERCREVMARVLAHIEAGELPALPVTAYPAAQVEKAFRYMVEAKQIGKVVVSYAPDERVVARPQRIDGQLLSAERSYLVAGGYSGFGLRTAEWLAAKGARTLVLVGRRAQVDDENRSALERLRALGVNLVLERADVADEAQVEALFERLRALPPLGGVIQAAMVLDDGALAQMSEEQFLRAVKPKVDGTWNLHRCTQGMPLDHFVMYSSMSWNTGTPGQGNYAAANAFLEGFADYRRRLGLPATTINWGVIGEIGYVARNKLDTLSRLGWSAIAPEDALSVVETCLRHGLPHASVFGVDWARSAEVMPIISGSKRLAHLIREEAERGGAGESGHSTLLEELKAVPQEGQLAHVVPLITEQIARVFDLPSERMKTDVRLTDLGMDSLMAGQIRNWLARHLEIDFPTMGLMRGPTIEQLSQEVLSMMHGSEAPMADKEEMASGEPSPAEWIQKSAGRSESAALRVFALPFVGGGASVYAGWQAFLPETVEVFGIQYPGRETRTHEPAIQDMASLVKQLAEAMLPHLDRSFMIYGHSMGGLVGYELALHLQEHYGEIAAKLIVGGWIAPPLVEDYVRRLKGGRPLETESDEVVLEVCRKHGLFSEEDVVDARFVASMMPSIRADLMVISGFRFGDRPLLRAPISVVRGDHDVVFSAEQLVRWREVTSGRVSVSSVAGGHLFIRGASAEVKRVIARELASDAFPRFTALAEAPIEAE